MFFCLGGWETEIPYDSLPPPPGAGPDGAMGVNGGAYENSLYMHFDASSGATSARYGVAPNEYDDGYGTVGDGYGVRRE